MNAPSIFDPRELWRPSIFSHTDLDLEQSIFAPKRSDLEPTPLVPDRNDGVLFDTSGLGFELPPLEDGDDDTPRPDLDADVPNDSTLQPPKPDHEGPQGNDGLDIWDIDLSAPSHPPGPRLHTWESFYSPQPLPQPSYLSEAGPRAFDPFLQTLHPTQGVLPQDIALQACCHLVQGRSSVFFRWDDCKGMFRRVLEGVSVSGTSLDACGGVVDELLEFGARVRRLGAFGEEVKREDCAGFVAFRRGVGGVVDAVEKVVSTRIGGVGSLLQLQGLVAWPGEVLKRVDGVAEAMGKPGSDEAVISVLADFVTELAESGDELVEVFRVLSGRVCAPWLARLAEDVGLTRGSYGSLSTGEEVEGSVSPFDAGREHRHPFLTEEDCALIRDTRDGIRLLRQHDAGHPLVAGNMDIGELAVAPGVTKVDAEDIMQRARGYEARLEDTIKLHRSGRNAAESTTTETWLGAERMDVNNESSVPDQEPPRDETLLDFRVPDLADAEGDQEVVFPSILAALENNDTPTPNLPQTFTPSPTTDLLAPLRPYLTTLTNHLTPSVLHTLFNTHSLPHHLSIHRSFHLFGNGAFASRLATAFFSADAQSAQRHHGGRVSSAPMGLRLGVGTGEEGGQRWPPASSELRLTLMDVLDESRSPLPSLHPATTRALSSNSNENKSSNAEGHLSFAIRELSEAEIDRVLDASSIYALDFLRLQYTPPPALTPIFSQKVVAGYDEVFRALLVVLRVRHTVTMLSRDCFKGRADGRDGKGDEGRRFVWKARHVVEAYAGHVMDAAIAGPWGGFMGALEALYPTNPVSSSDSSDADRKAGKVSAGASIHAITRLHEECLEAIRARMFLRRKQAPLRTAIEGIFSLILRHAASDGASDEEARASEGVIPIEREFDALVGQVVAGLGDVARKPSGAGKEAGMGLGSSMGGKGVVSESEAAGMLAARLEWWDGGK